MKSDQTNRPTNQRRIVSQSNVYDDNITTNDIFYRRNQSRVAAQKILINSHILDHQKSLIRQMCQVVGMRGETVSVTHTPPPHSNEVIQSLSQFASQFVCQSLIHHAMLPNRLSKNEKKKYSIIFLICNGIKFNEARNKVSTLNESGGEVGRYYAAGGTIQKQPARGICGGVRVQSMDLSTRKSFSKFKVC